jgi:cell wall-associated NlpC family hydrolase
MYRERTFNSATPTATRPLSGRDVVKEAEKYLGVRWRHQGRSKLGIDCIGLVICAARALIPRLENYDYTGYARLPGTVLRKEFQKQMEEVPASTRAPGVVFLFTQLRSSPYHVAICRDTQGGIIHAWLPARKVLLDRMDRNTFVSEAQYAFKFPEVVD